LQGPGALWGAHDVFAYAAALQAFLSPA